MLDQLPRAADLRAVFRRAALNHFHPKATVRCPDDPVYRTQLARDLACLLDVDDDVLLWSPVCSGVVANGKLHVCDFLVDYVDGRREHLDAVEFVGDAAITETLACLNRAHRFVPRLAIEDGYRLQNSKDLLRYAFCRTSLDDRVRLLAALDEAGSMTVVETFGFFRESPPMKALSNLILHRFISVDLDLAPIGPETIVRRFER
jgi:hypothetical protein